MVYDEYDRERLGKPKGSKNKPQIEQNSPTETQTLCKVCKRVPFGRITTLAFEQWRHEECSLGSVEWNLYYKQQPLADRKVLKEFYDYHKGVNYD